MSDAAGEADKRDSAEQESKTIPLDAKLLADAIIELNMSRRSVGLYPPGHAVITEALARSLDIFRKLFTMRKEITLGIARDALVIEKFVLDRKNPGYRDCALSFHNSGIASITFRSGMTIDELTALHEILTMHDAPLGQPLIELAAQKGLMNIRIEILDTSSLEFIEGAVRAGKGDGEMLWAEYVNSLIDGNLSQNEAFDMFQKLPPEQIAGIINNTDSGLMDDAARQRVTAALLGKKDDLRLSPESLGRLNTLIMNLNSSLRKQFLASAYSHMEKNVKEVETFFSSLSQDDFDKLLKLFASHGSIVPTSIRNILGRLSSLRGSTSFGFDLKVKHGSVVHDIEFDDKIAGIFDNDHFSEYVSDGYRKELDRIIGSHADRIKVKLTELRDDCNPEITDRATVDTIMEIVEMPDIDRKEYLSLIEKLAEFSKEFVQTGRFEDLLNVYNIIYSHSIRGDYRHEAISTLEFHFHSREFIDNLVDSIKIWGRSSRDEVIRLTRMFKTRIIPSLIDALTDEQNASKRKFIISLLVYFRAEVLPEVAARLNDDRWYVQRNMLYIIRECDNGRYADHVLPFASVPDTRVSIEAIKTLLKFRTPDSFTYLQKLLESKEDDIKTEAIRIASKYRVSEAVPTLVAMLEKKDILAPPSDMKTLIIRSLGEIGDTRALETLLGIFKERHLLYKGSYDELKAAIFRSLVNYPYSSIRQFIELGMKSDNEELRYIAENLSRKPKTNAIQQ